MKMRRWSLMLLAGLLLAWTIPAMAASVLEDPSHQIRAPQNRGAILEMKVLDTRGAPVSGVKITALGSDHNMREVVTNSRGIAILDGPPNQSTGTVHANKAHKKNVNWRFELESGMINECIVHYHVLTHWQYYDGDKLVSQKWQPLVVRRPEINDDKSVHWKPVSFVGPVLRESSKIVTPGAPPGAEILRELTYTPRGSGVITMARFRPSNWIASSTLQNMKMPVSTFWSLDTYDFVVKKVIAGKAAAPAQ
jgi:hypothetical protein